MGMIRTIAIWSCIIWSHHLGAHDIHVSVCDINVDGDRVEVVIKTFLDDLQLAVGLTPGEELPEDYTSSETLIVEYVKERIRFFSGDLKLDLRLEEISASLEAVWITMTLGDLEGGIPPTLKVDNSFLTEVYKDQTNLINLRKDGRTNSVAMDRKKKTATLKVPL